MDHPSGRKRSAPPQIHDVMQSKTHSIQEYIQTAEDEVRLKDQYLAIGDQEGGDVSDIPNGDPRTWINFKNALMAAATDRSHTIEAPGTQMLRRMETHKYTDYEFEQIFVELLRAAVDAQHGRCKLPQYADQKEAHYEWYNSFTKRMEVIGSVLRKSKDIVANLFSNPNYIIRLAWCPEGELMRKIVNQIGNKKKSGQNTVGYMVMNGKAVKQNDNGEWEDAEGNVVAGTPIERSEFLKQELDSSKERTRDAQQHAKPSTARKSAKRSKANTASSTPGPVDDDLDDSEQEGQARIFTRHAVNSSTVMNNRHTPGALMPDSLSAYAPMNGSSTVGAGSHSSFTSPHSYGSTLANPPHTSHYNRDAAVGNTSSGSFTGAANNTAASRNTGYATSQAYTSNYLSTPITAASGGSHGPPSNGSGPYPPSSVFTLKADASQGADSGTPGTGYGQPFQNSMLGANSLYPRYEHNAGMPSPVQPLNPGTSYQAPVPNGGTPDPAQAFDPQMFDAVMSHQAPAPNGGTPGPAQAFDPQMFDAVMSHQAPAPNGGTPGPAQALDDQMFGAVMSYFRARSSNGRTSGPARALNTGFTNTPRTSHAVMPYQTPVPNGGMPGAAQPGYTGTPYQATMPNTGMSDQDFMPNGGTPGQAGPLPNGRSLYIDPKLLGPGMVDDGADYHTGGH
ncbi:hypothetical protein F5B20DRAFT_587515 [Whalleya microplaca]|nr:hypothetical protein F5B20DRAFT_587515 [Whalleya microplaca]